MFSLVGLLFYLVLEIVRPEVLFPSVNAPIMLWVAIVTGAIWLIEMLIRQSWRTVPSTRFLVAFTVVSCLSTLLAGGDFSSILDRLINLGKILLMYLILIQCVRTRRQLRMVRWIVQSLLLWLVVGGILAVRGHEIPGFSYDVQHRLQYTGIFADPNDLGQMYAVIFTLLLYFIVNGRSWRLKIPAAVLLYLSGWAAVLTESRGALLGGVVGIFLCFRRRLGAVVPAVLAGVVLLGMVTSGIGRMGALRSDEASAEQRLLSWAQGWYMLRSHAILGVGSQNYFRYHSLAAHSSFIQVAAETGVVGLTCWLGFFFFPMKDALLAMFPGRRSTNTSFAAAQLQAALIVWFVTALFLTRNQTLPPYIFAGLAIVANCIHFEPRTEDATDTEPASANDFQLPEDSGVQEQPEYGTVSVPLVSRADLRYLAIFVVMCIVWWRYMISGLVVGI